MSRVGTTASDKVERQEPVWKNRANRGAAEAKRQVEVERDPRQLEGGQATEKTGG